MTLKSWREKNEVSQEALAKLLGVRQPTISRIEADEGRAPLGISLRIFDATGVRIGPLNNATKRDIAVLRRAVSVGVAA